MPLDHVFSKVGPFVIVRSGTILCGILHFVNMGDFRIQGSQMSSFLQLFPVSIKMQSRLSAVLLRKSDFPK